MINWKIRLKSKVFWMALIPAILVLVSKLGAPFGISWDFGLLEQELKEIVEAVFCLLTILGVVADPTTKGLSDSVRALSYEEPNDDR